MTSDKLQEYYRQFQADRDESTFYRAIRYHLMAKLRSLPPTQREDAAQEVSVLIWSALHNYKPDAGPLYRWISTIANNWRRDQKKSRAGRDAMLTSLFCELEGDSDDDGEFVPFEPIAASPPLPPADYSVLATIPDWLNDKDRELATLIMRGYSIEDTAVIMKATYQATAKRFKRLTRKCASRLSICAPETRT
jgi:DNA-directed RNA polymerase specialized sigma24 family protein